VDEAHEGGICFIIACGDAPELLEFGEQAFNMVTFFVQNCVVSARCYAV